MAPSNASGHLFSDQVLFPEPRNPKNVYFSNSDPFVQALKHLIRLNIELSPSIIIKPPYMGA